MKTKNENRKRIEWKVNDELIPHKHPTSVCVCVCLCVSSVTYAPDSWEIFFSVVEFIFKKFRKENNNNRVNKIKTWFQMIKKKFANENRDFSLSIIIVIIGGSIGHVHIYFL